jgi:hypothetical protein
MYSAVADPDYVADPEWVFWRPKGQFMSAVTIAMLRDAMIAGWGVDIPVRELAVHRFWGGVLEGKVRERIPEGRWALRVHSVAGIPTQSREEYDACRWRADGADNPLLSDLLARWELFCGHPMTSVVFCWDVHEVPEVDRVEMGLVVLGAPSPLQRCVSTRVASTVGVYDPATRTIFLD